MESLSIIIPIYNEEANLPLLYEKIKGVDLSQYEREIIFINDGSTDNSASVLNAIAEADPSVLVIHFRRNFGQTAAMMAGIDYSSGDVIIPMDGDLQNDPNDIPRLLAKIAEGYDVCSGWRKDRKDNTIKRNIPSKIANVIISWISGVHLHDYGCSLKAYKKSVIKDVKLYGEMHRFIPIYAAWQGAKITEIPVKHAPRIHGASKYGIERTLKVVLDLIVVKFLSRYSQKPIYVFGAFGVLNLFAAFCAGILALYYKFFGGKSFIETPLPLFVALTGITGIMCIFMGLLAEILMRTYYESQGKSTYLVAECRNAKHDPSHDA